MQNQAKDANIHLRILETPDEMTAIEDLQRVIWPGNETDIVPDHIVLTFAHNGGIVIGAYLVPETQSGENDQDQKLESELPSDAEMVGFVFGFPGLAPTSKGLQIKHCSHQSGVLPGYRDLGIGFLLKRAQWQMVRGQGLSRITWTYDPLQSRNAYLNIARLGAVCDTYIRDAYGVMRDKLNIGVSSDRFQVDWWVNSNRVERRLSRKVRGELDLAHFLAAGVEIINPTQIGDNGQPQPNINEIQEILDNVTIAEENPPLLLLEIPSDTNKIKTIDMQLAQDWRLHTRALFENLFQTGYLITDFIYLPGSQPRSFYVLSYGESTI